MGSSLTGPCVIDLADAMFYRCLYAKLLWEALGRLLSQDLASSAPAAAGAFYDDLVSLVFLGCSKELLV